MASATGNNSGETPGAHKSPDHATASDFLTNLDKSMGRASDEALKSAEESALTFLIEGEVIPRLMVAHSSEDRPQSGEFREPASKIEPAEAARFAALPLTMDTDELLQEVGQFLDRGVPAETIFVDLLAHSARRLGQLWESDTCDFVDVTMGLWRLQEVMHEVAHVSPPSNSQRQSPPSAMFSPAPGETHSFGALMVEEVFARAGWRSEVLLEPQRRELLRIIGDNAYDLVGLTVSCDCLSDDLKDLITAIRSVSKSPSTKVIIGGRMVNAHPELVEQCGADGTAADAMSALMLAEKLVLQEQGRAASTA